MDAIEQLLGTEGYSRASYEQQRLLSDEPNEISDGLEAALARFGGFPYKQPPYSARNWGHPMHSLCSYASKMKPAIASVLVSLFTTPGSVVLDPFAGSGTIPFEACQQGRLATAIDLSPLAYCLSAAKVRPPTVGEAACLMDELDDFLRGTRVPVDFDAEAEIPDYYHPDTFSEVVLAKQFFDEREGNGEIDRAHWFVKACVLHILHGNRPYALSRRSHGIIPIPPKGPTVYKPLLPSLRDKANRMRLDRLPRWFQPGVANLASAMELPIADGSVDAILTSPPFLGTTEFLRQNRVRLWFSGWTYDQQAKMKASGKFLEYHKTLGVYAEVLSEFRRVIAPTGLVVLHLGVVKKVDMGQRIQSMARIYGFDPVGLLYEDATELESHGRTDRGATHQHQFLFLKPV